MTERIITAAIAIAIIIAVFVFLGAVTAGYGQEPDPTTVAIATSIPPPPVVPHRSDVNASGAINVADLSIVASDFGEPALAAVCAILLFPDSWFEWVSC